MAKTTESALTPLLAKFEKHHEKTKALSYVMNVASFDAQTIAPKNDGAVNERSEAMGFWALESFKHQNDPAYDQLISDLQKQNELLSPEMKRMVYLERKAIDQLKKIDPKGNSEVTTRLRHTILSVNGDYNPKTIREFIEYGFLAKDSRAFREHFNSISPGINLKYTYTFDSGVEEDITVPIGVNFFWPDA